MKIVPKPGSGWRSGPTAIFAVAILILLAGTGVILHNESNYRSSKSQEVRVQAEILAASVQAALDFGDPVAADEAVNAFETNRQVRWVGVYDRAGNALATYRKSGEPAPMTLADVPEGGFGGIRVSVPVTSAGQHVGTVVFEADREPVSRRLSRYILLGFLFVLAALVVAVLGMAQAALRRANRELHDRAEALAEANALLEIQIEERAKAEEQLRQAQKMQALGQLTGGIAHDFNNLLTVIQGSADMLCRPDLPDDKRVRFSKAIVQASANAAALTSQLLAFARRQPLKPERIELHRLIREMGDMLDRTMGERIELEFDLDAESCTIEVDRNQLQSAILNVASNARDAMRDGGTLTIATRAATDADGEPMIALDISDTGTGMDSEVAERIFEPFFTTKSTGQGTGLGLSQVYGFASQSGGSASVRSMPGTGTTITLLLPCREGEAAQRAQAGPAVLAERSASILVVEDNEEVGAFADALLSELGHTVTRASSGEEALELAREQRFDIVFSDVVMPGMGGLQLAEALAEEQPELPVVLATGYSQEIAQSGSGGRPVILKPYRLSALSEALNDVLRDRDGA